MLFDRFGDDLKQNCRGIDQLKNSDCLNVMFNDQQSNNSREKESSLELFFYLGCEIAVQLSLVECIFEVVYRR